MKTITLKIDGILIEDFKKACEHTGVELKSIDAKDAVIDYTYEFQLFYLGSTMRLIEQSRQIMERLKS